MTTTLQSSTSLRRALYERHKASVLQVERLAAKVARIGERSWEELLGLVGAGSRGYAMDAFRVRSILESMLARLISETMTGFEKIADRSWRQTVNAWVANVPQEVWLRLLRERRQDLSSISQEAANVPERGRMEGMQERYDRNTSRPSLPPNLTETGTIVLTDSHLQEREPDEPALDEPYRMPEAEWRRELREVIFPAPSEQRINEILRSSLFPDRQPWAAHLAREGFSFDQIVGQVASGMSQGEAIGPMAKRIMPLVNNVRYRAVRIARTEGLRVADQMQRESWKHTAGITVGYQRVATLDARTRLLHRLLHRRIYWTPGNGPAGGYQASEMPLLPDAPNCRCIMIPLLSASAALKA